MKKVQTAISGENVIIDGDLKLMTPTVISCIVTGTVSSTSEVILDNGSITKGITAEKITIKSGNVDGFINASMVVLLGNAAVNGDITTNTLIAAPGSIINGHCNISSSSAASKSKENK